MNVKKTLLIASLLCTTALPSYANPEGGVVVGGSADIVEAGKKLDVLQHSDRAVIDWRGFDIAIDEHTQFHQANSDSIVVNRVNSADPSQILGKLSANGNVVLINPNGVFFGRNSVVDVNGLIASTADINTDRFMAGGKLLFDKSGNPNAAIVNAGTITAKEAGLVGFVAPYVENHGVIIAKTGRVHLASGDTATVDFYGDGLMQVAVSDDVTAQAVVNTGLIEAKGGTIALTAAAGKDIVNSLIIVSGELKAPAVAQRNGKIFIFAEGSNAVKNNKAANKGKKQGQSTILVDALIDASGREEGERGGQVEILGDQIAILPGTIIDASGDQGGGDIKIGGDYLGSGDTAAAKKVYVDDQTLIVNDALTHGNGGRTIVWSDDTTDFHGNIFARGGTEGGNGGFVETSGKENLKATGYVNLTARHESGDKGTYLLDPANITIYGNFAPTDIAGNVLWLDAADETTILDADGDAANSGGAFSGAVATWQDKSGNENHLSNANVAQQPNYNAGAKNGLGIVNFDGGDAVFITDANAPTLDFNGNGFTYMGLVNLATTGGNRILFNKENSYESAIQSGKIQAAIVTTAPGGWNWGGVGAVATGWQQLGFEHANTTWNFYKDGVLIDSRVPASNQTGNISPSNNIITIGARGAASPSSSFFLGDMAEILMYDRVLDTDSRGLLEQYKSTKWATSLTPPGTGGTEVAKATASDGYGAFTTRYLEKLSATADIALQATTNITLDLQGDTLTLANDRNISMTTTTGNITDVSAGSIVSNRTGAGGNITLSAGGDIDLNTTLINTQNGGELNMSATGDIDLVHAGALNLGTVSGTNVNIQTTGASDITLNNTLTSTAAGNSLILSSAQNFTNNAGAAALNAGAGRWLVYSADPVADTRGGLIPAFKRYNQTFGANPSAGVTATGNGLIYSIAPTLTITADDATRVEGGSNPSFEYSASGFIDNDTISSVLSGDPLYTTLAGSSSSAGTYAITLTLGALASIGYGFTFVDGTLTVIPAASTTPSTVSQVSQNQNKNEINNRIENIDGEAFGNFEIIDEPFYDIFSATGYFLTIDPKLEQMMGIHFPERRPQKIF